MSEVQFDSTNNPDEQVNYAIKLMINAYEMKTQMYENEIRRLTEELDLKCSEYEEKLVNISKEKEFIEDKLEGVINENKELAEQLEAVTQENEKLERFKNSILISASNFGSENVTLNRDNFESATPREEKLNNKNNLQKIPNNDASSFKMNSNMGNSPANLNNKTSLNNFTIYSNNTAHNKKVTNLTIPNKNKTISVSKSKDSKIESLIEKLNDSINNRLYSEDDRTNLGAFKKLNNYNTNEEKLSKNMEEIKSKINKSMSKENQSGSLSKILSNHSQDKNSNYSYATPGKNESRINNEIIPNMKKTSATQFKSLNINNLNKIQHQPLEIESLSRCGASIDEDRLTPKGEVNEKSTQYIQSSKFFSNCRIRLKQEEYSKLIDTLKLCNNNKIDKFEAFKRIEILLQSSNNHQLLNDFKYVFPTN